MPDVADSRPGPALPQIWRVPQWQPAALILVATVLLAFVIYGNFTLGPELAMVVVAAAALVAAGLAMRYLLVADEDGIWVRSLFAQQLVEWPEVADIDVTHVRGTTSTVRITRTGGGFVDVPPTLLQPTLPTSARKALASVGAVARKLNDLAEQAK